MNREEFKSKHDPSDEVRHLRAQVQELEGKLHERKQTSGQVREAMSEVTAATKVARAPELLYHPPTDKTKTPITNVVQLTDWHIGQTTNPDYVEEFGDFNYNLAVQRVGRLGDCIVKKVQTVRANARCDDCHIIGTADWVSGDIHDELVRTNEFPAPVQAVKAGYLLGSFIRGLSQHFTNVKVDLLTAGNHDRITRKPQSEDGGLNSWGYVTTEIAKQHVTDCPNVKVTIHPSLSKVVDVAGQRYLIYHGHGIKGTWGIPFYGIERKKQKEAMARMNMTQDTHFDKIVIGHFHTALNHEHWLIGGSLSGTTAFDHEAGRHSRPHQTSWFVHGTKDKRGHGEFDWTRWWL